MMSVHPVEKHYMTHYVLPWSITGAITLFHDPLNEPVHYPESRQASFINPLHELHAPWLESQAGLFAAATAAIAVLQHLHNQHTWCKQSFFRVSQICFARQYSKCCDWCEVLAATRWLPAKGSCGNQMAASTMSLHSASWSWAVQNLQMVVAWDQQCLECPGCEC